MFQVDWKKAVAFHGSASTESMSKMVKNALKKVTITGDEIVVPPDTVTLKSKRGRKRKISINDNEEATDTPTRTLKQRTKKIKNEILDDGTFCCS